MSDARLDVLRDALIEGRDAEATRLIVEIAEGAKPTPLMRLQQARRDVHLATGREISITVEVTRAGGNISFIHLVDTVIGRPFQWQSGDIEHLFAAVAPGISIQGHQS